MICAVLSGLSGCHHWEVCQFSAKITWKFLRLVSWWLRHCCFLSKPQGYKAICLRLWLSKNAIFCLFLLGDWEIYSAWYIHKAMDNSRTRSDFSLPAHRLPGILCSVCSLVAWWTLSLISKTSAGYYCLTISLQSQIHCVYHRTYDFSLNSTLYINWEVVNDVTSCLLTRIRNHTSLSIHSMAEVHMYNTLHKFMID